MASKQEPKVTVGGKEHVNDVVQVMASIFQEDPVYTWLLYHIPLPERPATLVNLLQGFITQGTLNHGICIEADNFGACGLFMPPGTNIANPWTLLQAGLIGGLFTVGPRAFWRGMFDYTNAVEPVLEKALTVEEQHNHWYVFIMGTAANRRREGLAGALLQHLQGLARGDGRLIWLEATTLESRELYLKYGFTVAGEVVLGKGKVGSDGLPTNDGPGVTIWSMFWRP
ncbi:hypothetical protein M426DRAFT_321216 [Hypoxylon sp. CI-4A]|nr:hypothetical protein M426DRAFT_321216 [Hypoxylon sp. CI-4A]